VVAWLAGSDKVAAAILALDPSQALAKAQVKTDGPDWTALLTRLRRAAQVVPPGGHVSIGSLVVLCYVSVCRGDFRY